MKPSTCWCSEMKVNSRFRVKWFQQVRSWMTCQSFIDMNKIKRLFLRSIMQWQRCSCGWGKTLWIHPRNCDRVAIPVKAFEPLFPFEQFFLGCFTFRSKCTFLSIKMWGTLEIGKYHWHLSFVCTMSRSCVGLGTLCFLAPTFNLF